MNIRFNVNKVNRKVLIHICCAPCSAAAIKTLCEECENKISFYWYNPNIYDMQEYKNRKNAAIKYAEELNIPFYEEKDFYYDYYSWKDKSLEKCNLCYKLRLEETVIFAKKNNFDFFSTSLLSSPYQKHDIVKQIADNLTREYIVEFLYKDFRINFYEGKNSLRQKGYYMQKYCGCNKSYTEISKQIKHKTLSQNKKYV